MDLEGAKKYILERLKNDLPKNLYYHGIHHTLDVCKAANNLAQEENVSTEEKKIIYTAALFHDAGFIYKYRHNEGFAVKLAKDVLPSFNYSTNDIDVICKIIFSTRVKTEPANLLEKIMCDADHDYLGRPDVKDIANSLYKELLAQGTKINKLEWNKIQLIFLKKHRYYTDTSIKLRQKNKLIYIDYIKGLK